MRKTLRNASFIPALRQPNPPDKPIQSQLDSKFDQAIKFKNVNDAFKLWSIDAENILNKIAAAQGHNVRNSGVPRGKFAFQEQRRFPRTIHNAASTLHQRKIFKALNRALEVNIAAPGYRRDRTRCLIREVLPYISSTSQAQVSDILATNFEASQNQSLITILQTELRILEANNRKARIDTWKITLREKSEEQFRWIKNKTKKAPIHVTDIGGHLTANMSNRLDALKNVWSKIYSQHKKDEPSFRQFMHHFGARLNREIIDLPPITEKLLIDTLKDTKPSAPGMDQFSPDELIALASWAPSNLRHLATLLNLIELTGRWPDPLVHGRVAFIPKDTGVDSPTADQFRPITILSAIYRTWAKARHSQLCEQWAPAWQSKYSYGTKKGSSADILALHTCLEAARLQAQDHCVAGVSYDMAKCFDSVPTHLAINVMRARGADNSVLRAIQGVKFACSIKAELSLTL